MPTFPASLSNIFPVVPYGPAVVPSSCARRQALLIPHLWTSAQKKGNKKERKKCPFVLHWYCSHGGSFSTLGYSNWCPCLSSSVRLWFSKQDLCLLIMTLSCVCPSFYTYSTFSIHHISETSLREGGEEGIAIIYLSGK